MKRFLGSDFFAMFLVLAAGMLLVFRPPADRGHGLTADYYSDDRFNGEPRLISLVRDFDISVDGNRDSSKQFDYSIIYEGFLGIETAGRYEFLLDSDDGSLLSIDDHKVVRNTGTHIRRRRQGSKHLSSGSHSIEIRYSQGVGDSFLRVRWRPPGEQDWQPLPLDSLTPVPEGEFDSGSVKASNRNRMILGLLSVLLLLLATCHYLFFHRQLFIELLRSAERRKSIRDRLLGSPVLYDIICILLCLVFYLQTISVRLPHEPYMKGDSPYYANIAISILYDFDLDQRNQSDPTVFEQPKPWTNIGMYDSNIARGTRGEWYPKHTIFMPFLSVPFYAVLGGHGFLVFNVAILLLLVVVMRRVACKWASPGAASIAAVLIGITPLFHHFAYSYSADILAAVLLVGGIGSALGGRGLAGGFLLGLSVWTKIPNAIGLVLAGGLIMAQREWKTFLRFCAGCAVSLGTFAGFNWYQFGAPWITSYSRVWVIERGVSKIADHVSSFDFPFFEGLRLQLVDSVHGLIPTAGASVLALLGYGRLFRQNRSAFVVVGLFSLVTFLFYCKYDFITGSHYSNRFLMPVVALAVIPLACLVDALVGRVQRSEEQN